MAKFLKIEPTGLKKKIINSNSEVANVETVTTTTTKIDLANGAKKYTITHEAPLAPNGVVLAIYESMKVNPGAFVWTVVAALKTTQPPATQSGKKGKILITQQAEYATFTSSVYENV